MKIHLWQHRTSIVRYCLYLSFFAVYAVFTAALVPYSFCSKNSAVVFFDRTRLFEHPFRIADRTDEKEIVRISVIHVRIICHFFALRQLRH